MSMFKSARVTYPKRRKKRNELAIHEIQEPVRKTMYDVVMENFKLLKRATYMHRVIYVGEHFYERSEDQLENLFRVIITTVNESYSSEKLSGFLLCYSKSFIHMVEGDEDSIYKHFGLLQNSKQRPIYLGTIKMLIHVSHISRRLVKDGWTTYFGMPSQYLGKINIDIGLEDSSRHIYNCIRKMYNLVIAYIHGGGPKVEERRMSAGSPYPGDDESLVRVSRLRSEIKGSMQTSNVSLRATGGGQFAVSSTDPYRNTLPEQEIVDFTINTSFTRDIAKYCEIYGAVPQRLLYKDRIWPCPRDNIQYDVFSKPYDTVTDLPKPARPDDFDKTELSEAFSAMTVSVQSSIFN